ncbi:hypothetical protein [Massilia yuzhufengensis]|uniref:Alpha/beta hydrolase family protein n=1 Tax=Massilia yuzhufengensis TaxID=1164594 RepID=A0A1I1FRP2_9BURK|nr:hypothetical protein [Massilia yuzhufengensis]SFC02229.1 hypothetical protein SAMN05216204_10385 [Massilia yuzhufengensis]
MRIARTLLTGLGGLLAGGALQAASLQETPLGQDGHYRLSYYSNQPLAAAMPAITRVVIVVHGILRDADRSLASAESALAGSGADGGAVLLVAPQFWNEADAKAGKVAPATPYWHKAGWSLGYDSGDGRALSSFTVIDDLVRKFADPAAFPGVRRIVVAGHSAGAQMISRHAAFNTVHDSLRKNVSLRYVVANAGTYMYFTGERTADTGACPGYDAYKYGTASFPDGFGYPHGQAPLERFRRFAARDISFLQGTDDTRPATAEGGPDGSCAALLGGATRLARGVEHARHLRALARREGASLHSQFHRVQGVGHDEGRMWAAACAAEPLFGAPKRAGAPGAACAALD